MTFLSALTTLLPFVLAVSLLLLSARSRAGVVFGVTVPVEAAHSDAVRSALKRYRILVSASGVAVVLLCLALWIGGHADAGMIVYLVGLVSTMALAFTARSREAARLRPLHVSVPVTRTAGLDGTTGSSAALAASAAAVLPLLAAAAWLKGHWQNAPARWPRHWDAHGQVNAWATRSLAHMMMPLVMGVFLTAVFTTILALQTFAPGPDMRRRQRLAAPLTAMAWAFSLFLGYEAIAPTVGGVHDALLPIAFHAVVILGIVVWICVRSGVMSAVNPESNGLNALPAYDGTADQFWHAGLFYYNPADAAVLVPKRFGFGWTFNYARPVVWIFTLAILILATGSVVLPLLLK